VYVPGLSGDSTLRVGVTVSVAGVFPLAGVTETKLPPVAAVNAAVNGTFPPVAVN
jgi:preprotein translocase subunit SecB